MTSEALRTEPAEPGPPGAAGRADPAEAAPPGWVTVVEPAGRAVGHEAPLSLRRLIVQLTVAGVRAVLPQ
ncbi:MAG: hypothetical protein ACR2N4_19355 [Jatrophihabitans sp.]